MRHATENFDLRPDRAWVNDSSFGEVEPPPVDARMDWVQSNHVWPLLDEIDYGLMVVAASGALLYANRLAQWEIASDRFLVVGQLAGPGAVACRRLQAHPSVLQSSPDLQATIAAAALGKRQMLSLKRADACLPLALVPLPAAVPASLPGAVSARSCSSVLVMLARRPNAPNLALSFFARSHGLSAAEEMVLRALSDGRQIKSIALSRGVSESTIRTQVRSLREKTSCRSIRNMLALLSNLPPMVSLCSAPASNPPLNLPNRSRLSSIA